MNQQNRQPITESPCKSSEHNCLPLYLKKENPLSLKTKPGYFSFRYKLNHLQGALYLFNTFSAKHDWRTEKEPIFLDIAQINGIFAVRKTVDNIYEMTLLNVDVLTVETWQKSVGVC